MFSATVSSVPCAPQSATANRQLMAWRPCRRCATKLPAGVLYRMQHIGMCDPIQAPWSLMDRVVGGWEPWTWAWTWPWTLEPMWMEMDGDGWRLLSGPKSTLRFLRVQDTDRYCILACACAERIGKRTGYSIYCLCSTPSQKDF